MYHMIHWVPLAFKLANGFLMSTFWSENFIACKQCHKRFGEISKGLVQLGPTLYSGWGFLSWTSPFVHCRVCKRKDLFFSSAFWLVFWTGPYRAPPELMLCYLCYFDFFQYKYHRDVSTRATGATAVAPKFSDTLTLFQPGGADSAHHWHGRT